MKRNLMDDWLVDQGDKVLVNLGESSVADLAMTTLASQTLLNSVSTMTLGNTATAGSERLRRAVAQTYVGVEPDAVLITAGVSEALVAIAMAHFVPGANAVVPTPAFHALYDVPELLGYGVRKVELRAEEGFALPVERVIAAIDADTRLVILNSPHNPTGVIYAAQDIAAVVAAADAVGAVVIVDQHYRFLPRGVGQPADVDALPGVTLLGSIGKCFGCTGLRIGWIVAGTEHLERYATIKLLLTHSVSVVSDAIAVEVLEQRDALLAAIAPAVVANAAALARTVAASHGALVLLPDTGGTTAFVRLANIPDTMAFAQRLLDDTGVLVLPGESFDCPGYIRIGLGAEPSAFARACSALLAAVAAHAGSREPISTHAVPSDQLERMT